jgi:hypothetical protein
VGKIGRRLIGVGGCAACWAGRGGRSFDFSNFYELSHNRRTFSMVDEDVMVGKEGKQ